MLVLFKYIYFIYGLIFIVMVKAIQEKSGIKIDFKYCLIFTYTLILQKFK